ncbi:MAG: ATP-grasp domain-containing protein [Gammaproteobacteria bacterium]|nr:ATP-grasp domain-containing protein [Gammaproteobacteria bacterium]MDH3559446.1 ATP-grasp domain-containing protein [Gammaproteobacteria bacterium]
MSPDAGPVLIGALSGRALASSAYTASMPVVVLDVFGDMDMRVCASDWGRVGNAQGGIDRAVLLEAAERLCPPDRCGGLVYGAGFESCPDVLAELAENRDLLGNDPRVLDTMGSPERFFSMLEQLGIPYPAISYRRPENTRGWLAKRAGASGGGHIRTPQQIANECGYYFQRKMQGRIMSVLFLANGREASIVGISEQWNAAVLKEHPYSYGGAVSDQEVSPRVRADLRYAINACVEKVGLRGLNSMDLVLDGEEFQVLEINARPTATAELYESESAESLFKLHIKACRGKVPHDRNPTSRRYAHLMVYAEQGLKVPRGFRWPNWCSDRPPAETRIDAGEPICSVHASGTGSLELRGFLERRRRFVCRALTSELSKPHAVLCMAGG